MGDFYFVSGGLVWRLGEKKSLTQYYEETSVTVLTFVKNVWFILVLKLIESHLKPLYFYNNNCLMLNLFL